MLTEVGTHFAIGLVVDIRDGARPCGWPEDTPFDEAVPKFRQITAVGEGEPGFEHGTFEVGGWFWNPEDLS